MKKKSDKDHEPNLQPARRFKFYLGSRQRYIFINTDFDSGNVNVVRQISEFQYRLASVHDGVNTNHKVNSKSWFYFSVVGFPKKTTGKFFIAEVQTLQGMYNSKYNKSYRPVYRVGDDGEWLRIPTESQLVMRQSGELECVFEYSFKDENEKVYFAFCYPYTYTDYQKHMQELNQFIYNDEFYFHKEILVRSPQNRDLHLLTITSYDHQDKVNENEENFDENLFPEKARPLRFNKPVVLVSARVHPGETPSSFAMNGVIKFLTSKTDLRAHLLRKMFVFMIVPMINVDGVFHGHFRMDIEGKNLNRYYIKPCIEKQPAIYAIKELANYLNIDNRLSFYFDLHAHNAKKGCFIYGNAINDFVEQVESQVFCKLISMNNKGFEYECCNFTQKHMKAKDRNENLTKEGCGRVVMHKLAKIIHSYSVECGIVSPNKMNWLPDPQNADFKLGEKGFIFDRCEDNSSHIYKTKGDENAFFTPEMYENLGKNLMVSVLDVFDKNPFNRVYNSKFKSMDMLRRLTAFEIFHEAQRFRMFERFIFGKVKNINQLIREVLNMKLHYKQLYNFYFFDDVELKNVEWPNNIPGLAKPKCQSPTKFRRFKSIDNGTEYSESFLKILMGEKKEELEISQEELEVAQKDSNSKSSQTQDYNEQKQLMDELSDQIPIFIDDSPEKRKRERERESSFSPVQKQSSKSEVEAQRQNNQLSVRLCVGSGQQMSNQTIERKKQNASVRVRRLLKQDFTGTFKSDREIQDRKQSERELSTTGVEIKKSIYESIKQQIKEELKREQFREARKRAARIECQTSNTVKISSPVKIQKERIKSWSVKRGESSSKQKLQLPALGAQMYIISTSTKTFLKKN